MPKRSIGEYKPVGLALASDDGYGFVSDRVVAEMVSIGGPLPTRPIAISVLDDVGKTVDAQISGRKAMQHFLNRAARGLHLAREDQVKPTARQLAAEFEGIAIAARRLLVRLKVGSTGDTNNMPQSLRFGGMLPFAAQEAERLVQGRHDPMADEVFEWSGDELLQEAVRGVDRLARWADAARARKERTARERPTIKRNEGDTALDDYVGRVVVDCWCVVCGHEIAEGPKLFSFVRCALDGVGVKLSDAAVRDRIRRAMGRRGKSKSKQS
jgi:hypothetical protein